MRAHFWYIALENDPHLCVANMCAVFHHKAPMVTGQVLQKCAIIIIYCYLSASCLHFTTNFFLQKLRLIICYVLFSFNFSNEIIK